MSLVSTLETLQKRPLTPEEVSTMNEFQHAFQIGDDDPLLVVLAMMARSQLIVDSVPSLLQQKVAETIELHRMTLRDQAVLIAKELISTLAQDIYQATEKNAATRKSKVKANWGLYVGCFVAGLMVSFAGFGWAKYLGVYFK